jgi:hypothetical protein
MATNEQKRQKKLQQKKKKQKLGKKLTNIFSNRSPVSSFASYPIHECLVPDNLFESGIGQITISRRSPSGEIGISAFIVDVYCLGVKNALFTIADDHKYQTEIRPSFTQSHGIEFENVHPTCARKIIEGAVDYAAELGFKAHTDYRKYKTIFGDIDKSACPVKYTFGKEGKPFYINGPNESQKQSEQIISQLEKKCGKGNYDYIMGLSDDMFGEE